MAVFRVHKSGDFTTMSNHHLRNKELSLKAKGLLTVMLSLPDEWDYSVLGLASLSKDGKDAIMSTLDELKEHGYLSMTMTRNDKGHIAGWTYDVYETPSSKNQNTEKPYAEKPNTDNPTQLNTNKSNTNQSKTKSINDLYSSEINIPQNNKSYSKKEKESFDLSFVNIAFEDVFNEWLDYKRGRHEMYKTQKSLEICYRKLLKFSHNDPHTAQEIIESAIGNNYSGFFELKTNNNNGQQQQQNRNPFCDLADAITAAGGIL